MELGLWGSWVSLRVMTGLRSVSTLGACVGYLVGWLTDWMIGRLADLSAGWPVGLLGSVACLLGGCVGGQYIKYVMHDVHAQTPHNLRSQCQPCSPSHPHALTPTLSPSRSHPHALIITLSSSLTISPSHVHPPSPPLMLTLSRSSQSA